MNKARLKTRDLPADGVTKHWEWPDPRDKDSHYSVLITETGLQYGAYTEPESGERYASGWTQTFDEFESSGPPKHMPEALARELAECVRRFRGEAPEGDEVSIDEPRPPELSSAVTVPPLREQLRREAERQGEIPAGSFRVVVLESDLRISHHDFSTGEDASAYANDAASEADDNPPIAYVFNDLLQVIYEGRPYWEGAGRT